MWSGSRIKLDDIAIAAPCNAVWAEMSGDDRKRVCRACKLSVFNLSELSRKEAENLLNTSKPGSFCIKLFRRADGTILTKDCPVGLRLVAKAKFRLRALVSAVLAIFAAGPANARYSDSPVERYGFFVTMKTTFGPPLTPNSRLVNARIGEQGGMQADCDAGTAAQGRQADHSLIGLFNHAREFQKLNNPILAFDYYESALALIRYDGQKYDPKFVNYVVSSYVRYLRQNKRADEAKLIEKQLKTKTLITQRSPAPTGAPIPDNG
jgi:hypothetical protein